MNRSFLCYAACSFGLEAVVSRQLKELGMKEVTARDARVYFYADEEALAKANLWVAAADRIYLVLKEFSAHSFGELFEGIRDYPWQEVLAKDARFPVLADSVRSTLKSVPDIQKISKKAIVESLKKSYGVSFFKESGMTYEIYVSILADRVSMCLNTSGNGLNRRGYRVRNCVAPLRETLAAGMIELTRWRDRPFYDITCGSGTIAIEAARKARHIAPGMGREFAAQFWSDEMSSVFRKARLEAEAAVLSRVDVPIFASDLDENMVQMSKFHARRGGVLDDIKFSVTDAREFLPETQTGTVVSNPPYAIRLGQQDEVRALYKGLGQRMRELSDFKYYFLCADEHFESSFGKKADKKRKLYNGNVRCFFFQYFR